MIAAALALAGVTAGPGVAPVAVADGVGVRLEITGVTPNVWSPGQVLQITGTVTNDTGDSLDGVRVVLWQSSTPIRTLDAFDDALTAGPSDDGTDLTTMTLEPLDNGVSQGFTIEGTPLTSLAPAGAAFVAGIQVLDEAGGVLARARLLIGSGGPPSGALVVVLTTRPSLLKAAQRGANPAPALFMDDHLASELQTGLGGLLKLAQQPGVTPVIDPGLVDDLTQMAAGYNVAANADVTPVPGAGQADAEAALTVIDAIIAQGDAYRTLSGDPDMRAVAAQAQGASIVAASANLPESSPLASLPLALVQRGSVTPGVLSLIDGLSPSVVVTDALKPSVTVQGNLSTSPWVAATPIETLSSLTGPRPAFTGAGLVQPALSRLARFTVADGQGDPTVLLVDNASDAATVSSFIAAGWQPRPLSQVATGRPVAFDWVNNAASAPPSAQLTALITRVQGYLSVWADLGDIDNAPGTAARRFLPPALSSSWAGDWAGAEAWLSQASASLAKQVGSGDIQLRVAPEWYLASANNRMPVTIVNTMGIPVQVKVHFVSENEQRLSIPDTQLVTIAPGDATTVQATPRTASNGSVQVTVSLATSNGLPVGASQTVQVVTTAFGRMGWVIIIGAGLAFVIATSLRVRQVRHLRAAAAASGTMETAVESSPVVNDAD